MKYTFDSMFLMYDVTPWAEVDESKVVSTINKHYRKEKKPEWLISLLIGGE